MRLSTDPSAWAEDSQGRRNPGLMPSVQIIGDRRFCTSGISVFEEG